MRDEIRERVSQFSIDWMLSEHETDALHDLVEDLLLAERAAALGAAGDVCEDRRRVYAGDLARALTDSGRELARSRMGVASVIRDAIRSLPPEGLVAVRAEDLAVVKEAASMKGTHLDGCSLTYDESTMVVPCDCDFRIRAAIERMP